MKILLLIFYIIISTSAEWLTNMENAKSIAARENKMILLNFSGSDWCSPCINLKKEVFDDPNFQHIANENLVLVRADFPRTKKNKLSASQTTQNEMLAEQFNTNGKFPFTVLLDKEGSVMKSWDGYHSGHSKEFLKELESALGL